MFETTSASTATTVAKGKNEVTNLIKEKMGICPYYGTTEILDEVLIQKSSWGGKEIPQNKVKLSSSANVAYVKFAENVRVKKDLPFSYYQELYKRFLASERPKITHKERFILTLKAMVAVRIAFMDGKNAMEARIRNRGKDLDLHFPIENSTRLKVLEKFRQENEPLLEEIQDEFSWQNLIGYATAQMGYVQRSVIEKEIEKMVEQMPIWQYFGKHIPGFGAWTCALFAARLCGPKDGDKNVVTDLTRFPDSGKVRAFCGVAPKDGKTMKAKRGEKLSYDPSMKEVLCKVFPESFMKIAGKFPDEPYAEFFRQCQEKQKSKAIVTRPIELAKKFLVPVENVTNLGFEEREVKDKEGKVTGHKKTFLGFKIKKENGEEITTLNPGHVHQRAMREFGAMFVSDFYHAWLFLAGENVRVEINPRIMAVFQKANA